MPENPSPSLRPRRLLAAAALLAPLLLAACGDTWRGLKKDTGENLEKTGQAIEKAGGKVKN